MNRRSSHNRAMLTCCHDLEILGDTADNRIQRESVAVRGVDIEGTGASDH